MSPNNYELNDLTPDVDKDLSFSTSEKSLTLESVENKENLSLIFKDNDLIPPSKIKDLEPVTFDYTNKLIKFHFTAPGDDYDIGKSIFSKLVVFFKVFLLKKVQIMK